MFLGNIPPSAFKPKLKSGLGRKEFNLNTKKGEEVFGIKIE
jgi:hypothetical protein